MESFDQAMQIVGLTSIHLLSSSSTKMAHFLDVCVQIEKVLQPNYGPMMSANMRDDFFTAINLFCLKVLNDIQEIYCATYLRKVGLPASFVSEVYTTSQTTTKALINFSTSSTDRFLESLCFDTNGNLCSENMVLNHQHRCPRGQTHQDTLINIKIKLCDLKICFEKS